MIQQPQPTFPALNVNFTPEGMQVITVLAPGTAFTQTLPNDAMNQIVAKYLEMHPELLQQLAQQAMAAKQQELAVIQHIHKTKS